MLHIPWRGTFLQRAVPQASDALFGALVVTSRVSIKYALDNMTSDA